MKTALVFGSSGLIGGHLLNQLIKNDNYNKIKLFVRSELIINEPKVEIIKTDFNNLDNYKEDAHQLSLMNQILGLFSLTQAFTKRRYFF
jgi:nucleoside-diphosphate-sugar epimerase